jgi:hypothetical protein
MVDDRGLEQLGAQFEELSRLVGARSGPPDADRLVSFAARVVPHGELCGLTLTRRSGRPATVASSGPLVEQVDQIQYETGEGPCLEAVEGHDVVRVADLATDLQWPRFAQRCVAETGVRSMFSVRLVLSGDDRAALNFYAHRPGVMDDLDVGTGAIVAPFAAQAVQGLLQEQEIGQLRTALHSSRQIGIAVGILMSRRLLTAEQAFAQLVKASQHLNRKLRDIAVEVEHTGVLPDVSRGRGPAAGRRNGRGRGGSPPEGARPR